jgi:bleomycin hydrolase
MKKILIFLFISAFTLSLVAQNAEPYDFKEYKRLPATPVKSQDMTGTCWSFSTTSFLESEVLRLGKGEHNLSEMFTVRHIYRRKCENYVRRLGKAQFSEGGLAHDNINVVGLFGVAPESVYPGRKDPSQPFNHSQLVQQLKKMCDEYIAMAEKGQLKEDWLKAIDQALDAEFGPVPTQFTYNNTVFTPTSFRDYLGLNADDYVNITSYTHHPFWTSFILEVPDNFANGSFYNLPLGELIRCLNHSVQQGYTVEWDADVSNQGFAANYGIAVVPEADWAGKSKEQIAGTFKYYEPEKVVDQQLRQRLFDRLETQDDHLMHIVGMMNETHGGIYYVVKNS